MMSIEEQVIQEKLKKYSNAEDTGLEKADRDSICDIESARSGVRGNLTVLKNNEVNTSARYIKMEAGIRGKLNWLKKKVVRRLSFFYVQPVCDQLTVYNTAATQCIEKLLEIETGLENKMTDQEKKIADLKKDKLRLKERLQKSDFTIQKELSAIHTKLEQYSENMKIMENAGICRLAAASDSRTVKSYAQSGEDAIILFLLPYLKMDLKKAAYLDIGANHAKELSNTFALYERGMRGVLLEANPALIPELKLYRSEDIIVNKCLSLHGGQTVTFYVLSGDGLSTPDRHAVETIMDKNPGISIVNEITVETVTIQELLDQYFSQAPELLNIDIEGAELEILNAIDFSKVRPKVIIVEMIAYSTMINAGNKNQQILKLMRENNYIEYAFTGINSIFVDASVWEHR